MTRRWLIIADDLTGAADAGIAFARRGCVTEVTWGKTPPPEGVSVHALDLDSRACEAYEAAARHRHAVLQTLEPGQSVFKKVDSTLRGQPAAEIAAMCAALRERGRAGWGVLAPANPPQRRTTRDGRVFVAGEPLEHTETWKREHSYPEADLVAIVKSAGLRAIKLPLSAVRGDADALRADFEAAAGFAHADDTVVICDSETDDDLVRIVRASESAEPGFFIGAAGLANALAARMPAAMKAGQAGGPKLDATERGTLVAVGTPAEVSRAAARRVAEREGRGLVRVEPEGSRHGPSDALFAMSIAARLIRGETAVAMLEAPLLSGSKLNAAYAGFFAEVLTFALERMGALIVTGGETAAALLARCRVHGIRLLDEIEPGIALGVTRGEVEVPIITKPGAFGDEESLVRCLDALKELRRTA